jgi:hypothetical protein
MTFEEWWDEYYRNVVYPYMKCVSRDTGTYNNAKTIAEQAWLAGTINTKEEVKQHKEKLRDYLSS